ncbi:PAS domain S-box protein [Hymenobacter norwichensis]|uniref:PAS domain S-box protein n=1 Tax=Hymenobacter norwichensis TaxID=223903 RepID=UPI0003B3FFB7|nr:PAS domain S-box protein [Hymenobacter norwichensis]
MDFSAIVPPDSSAWEILAATAALLDTLPCGVLALDAQGVIRHVNQQAAQWCGTSPESLLGQPLTEIALPADLAAALLYVLESGATVPHEIWRPHTEQWLSLRQTPAPAGYRWVLWENVTARKQAEAAQQRSNQLLLDLEEVAHTGFYDADLVSGTFYFSNGMYQLFGEEPQSFVPTLDAVDARSHPDDVALVRQVLDEAVRTGQPYTYRRRIRRPSGEQRILEAHGNVRCNEAGTPIQLRGLVQDITERVQAEQALGHSRELLQRTIDSSLDMVQVFEAVRDEQGVVVDFAWVLNNAAAERAHGNVIGQRLCQLNPGVVESGIFDTFKQVLETGVPDRSERHYRHEQFNGWFFQSTVKLGDGVTTTTHDITSRKQAEQEILRLKEEIAQQTTDKYRALFNSIDEGFCLQEMVVDETGRNIDWRILEVNGSYYRQTGLPAVTGKLVSEVLPNLESTWRELYRQAVLMGEAFSSEVYNADTGRWYHTRVSRVGGAGSRLIGFVFENITARKRREANLTLLAEVGQDLAQLTNIDETMRQLGARLGAHFAVARVVFSEISAEGQTGHTSYEWHRAGLPAMQGSYPIQDYFSLEFQQFHRAGGLAIVSDTAHDERVNAARYAALGVGSFVGVPCIRHNQWCFYFSLLDAGPRVWLTDEIELLRELTARIWSRLERARAEEALRVSEAKYRTLFESIDEGFCLIEMLLNEQGKAVDYRFLEVNPTFERQTGLAHAVGRLISELTPSTEAHWFDTYKQVLYTGEPARFENYHAGTERWYEASASRVDGSESRQIAIVFNDITARKQAEIALQLSEQRLRALITNLPGAAAFVVGADLRYQLAGGEALEAAGLTPTDLLGRTVAEVMPPDVAPQHEAHYRQALTGQGFSVEHAAHGHTYISRGVPLLSSAGVPEAVLVVSYDITERKQAEEALRASEAQLAQFNTKLEQRVARRTRDLQASRDLLQSVFDTSLISMSVLYAVRDETGQVQDFRLGLVNRELERETGRTDLVGKLYAAEYPGIREVGIFNLMRQALHTDEPQGMEYFYEHEGFQRWFACQFVKLGDGVVAINLDITARKTAEEERFRNLQLLEQAEAVAGLGSWDYHLLSREFVWSDGMYQLFNLPQGQLVTPDVYLQFARAEDQRQAKQIVAHITAGTTHFEETLRLRVNEQIKTVRIKGVVHHDEAGQPVRVLGVNLDISELQRLEADNLRLRLTRQQALFEAVQAAQETERKRMAESLHNGIGQILYATKLRLDQLHVPLQGTAPTVVAARREADQLLSEAIRQARVLSHELVPTVLEEFGLAAALQDISRKMSTPQLRLRSHVVFDDAVAPLPPTLQMALYRIAQELAQNIVKHARGATEASLELETMPGWVLLRAEDNGPGFIDTSATNSGLGLRSIRNRVALLGGELEIGSAPLSGAYVRIRIPLLAFTTP